MPIVRNVHLISVQSWTYLCARALSANHKATDLGEMYVSLFST